MLRCVTSFEAGNFNVFSEEMAGACCKVNISSRRSVGTGRGGGILEE